jgi:hypothetical protein
MWCACVLDYIRVPHPTPPLHLSLSPPPPKATFKERGEKHALVVIIGRRDIVVQFFGFDLKDGWMKGKKEGIFYFLV